MDFPVFHLDWMGNRMLIAVMAILHVAINHPLAVGIYPLITILEIRGFVTGDQRWTHFARKLVSVAFIITTTFGALTGVGIWLSTALVAPYAIGSLLRVFFWAWVFEWGVFITEVVLILAYYSTWDTWTTGWRKRAHIGLGVALSVFSWLTMAVIVAILAFMMTPGDWSEDREFWSAFLNPLYVPQLAFRTTFAMSTAGLFAWFFIGALSADDSFRGNLTRAASIWTLVWSALLGASACWYWDRVPQVMAAQVDVALMTQQYLDWKEQFLWICAAAIGLITLVSLAGIIKPQRVPRAALVVPFILGIWLLGHFERVREFIRKPYVIAGYMYTNGVRVDELALFQKEGILPHSTFASVREVTEENKLEAGREVFRLACSRCHTTHGTNGIVGNFQSLFGDEDWRSDRAQNFIQGMHLTRPFMPPFPGNEKEAKALTTYVQHLRTSDESLPGAQEVGIFPVATKVR